MQAVDTRTFKQDPEIPTPDPKHPNRHPVYSDRKPNGEWAPGNSGRDGFKDEQDTSGARERRTRITIGRQKINSGGWPTTAAEPASGGSGTGAVANPDGRS